MRAAYWLRGVTSSVAAVVLAGTVAGACGGGSGTTAPPAPEVEAPHDIVFLGDIPEHLQDEIRYEADLAVGILREVFGVTPPETTITFARTREQLTGAYREATGRELHASTRCFAERLPDGRHVIFIHIANCGFGYTVGDNASLVLAHEYFHVLQHSLATALDGPLWLIEGSAEYAMARVGAQTKRYDYTAFRNSTLLRAASWTGTLREAGDDVSFPAGHEHYFLGFLAVELLVERAGEGALLEYFRLLPTSARWQDAFESAFGITSGEFYEAFEAVRAEALANYRAIRGRVVGPGGEPRDKVTLWAFDQFTKVGGVGESAPDGTFSIGLTRDGNFRVEVHAVDETGLCNLVGWYHEGEGLTAAFQEATYVDVEGGDVTVIDIPLPARIELNPRAGYCIQ